MQVGPIEYCHCEKFKDPTDKLLAINAEEEEKSPVIVATKQESWEKDVEFVKVDL